MRHNALREEAIHSILLVRINVELGIEFQNIRDRSLRRAEIDQHEFPADRAEFLRATHECANPRRIDVSDLLEILG